MGSNMYRRPTMPQTRQAPPLSRPNPAQGCEELLRAIAEADFFAQDLKLYLDTHPGDKRAVEMFVEACPAGAGVQGSIRGQLLSADSMQLRQGWLLGLAGRASGRRLTEEG